MHDWLSLVYHGDEWFVSYACIPSGLPSVVTFSVGHAVELYLKGTHTKVFGDIQKAIRPLVIGDIPGDNLLRRQLPSRDYQQL
jgi:hypothetical protein